MEYQLPEETFMQPSVKPSLTRIRALTLPTEVVQQYEAEANSKRATLESVLESRLTSCVSHTSASAIYLSDSDRQSLVKMTGRTLSSAADIIKVVERVLTINLENVSITLPPLLTTRLRTRCFTKDFEAYLRKRVVEGLEEYCGMR